VDEDRLKAPKIPRHFRQKPLIFFKEISEYGIPGVTQGVAETAHKDVNTPRKAPFAL
jgi:hypothetical protein